jgi:hypothetical protein
VLPGPCLTYANTATLPGLFTSQTRLPLQLADVSDIPSSVLRSSNFQFSIILIKRHKSQFQRNDDAVKAAEECKPDAVKELHSLNLPGQTPVPNAERATRCVPTVCRVDDADQRDDAFNDCEHVRWMFTRRYNLRARSRIRRLN